MKWEELVSSRTLRKTKPMETALDLLPTHRAAKKARWLRLEANGLAGEARYLEGLCGPHDNDWLRVAVRMSAIAADLEAEAGLLERIAKRLDKWARLAFAAAPPAEKQPMLLEAAEWRVVEGGRSAVPEPEPHAVPIGGAA